FPISGKRVGGSSWLGRRSTCRIPRYRLRPDGSTQFRLRSTYSDAKDSEEAALWRSISRGCSQKRSSDSDGRLKAFSRLKPQSVRRSKRYLGPARVRLHGFVA